MLNLPHQNRLCAYAKTTASKPALCLLLNRLCIGTKPAFSFWINISTVSEVRFDCQGLGLVARNEASILVFDTKPVLYRPVLDQIQFCSFDRGCKTCLDTKPVFDQGRFCSLTDVSVSERPGLSLFAHFWNKFNKFATSIGYKSIAMLGIFMDLYSFRSWFQEISMESI